MQKCLNCGMIGIEMSPLEQIEAARANGFEAVDLYLGDGDDPQLIRDAMDRAGVKPGNAVGLVPGRVSADEKEWKEGVRVLPSLLERFAKAGFDKTTIVVMPFDEDRDYGACMDFHISRLREVAPILADRGIRLGLEYVSPQTRREGYRYEFVHNLKGLLELLDWAGQKNMGILLDSFHWYCAGETREDLRKLSREQIVTVHVNDAVNGRDLSQQNAFERELPGATGKIDITGFLVELSAMGYSGPVVAEPMNRKFNGIPTEEKLTHLSLAMDKILKP